MNEVRSQQSRYFRLTSDPSAQFWLLNLLGWMGISLVTYLSLSLPYDQFEASYLAHNLLQSVLGLLLSLPMRSVFRAVWSKPTWLRLLVISVTVFVLSAIWAAVRLLLFMVMTGESNLLQDYGGWLFPSIFVFFSWAALYHGVKYHQLLQREHDSLIRLESSQRQEALARSQAESAAREAQLRLLRYQLNPHFLFNSLNAVSALVNNGRASDAKLMLARLSGFLRYSLESGDQLTVPISEEVKAAVLYLEIEQVRFSDRLKLDIDIASEAADVLIPNLLLQPLLENAIKYAISASKDGGIIRVAAELNRGCVVLTVEDSGPDTAASRPDQSEHRTGIGLANTQARLHNHYGDRARLDVTDSALGGICVRLHIPMTSKGVAFGDVADSTR